MTSGILFYTIEALAYVPSNNRMPCTIGHNGCHHTYCVCIWWLSEKPKLLVMYRRLWKYWRTEELHCLGSVVRKLIWNLMQCCEMLTRFPMQCGSRNGETLAPRCRKLWRSLLFERYCERIPAACVETLAKLKQRCVMQSNSNSELYSEVDIWSIHFREGIRLGWSVQLTAVHSSGLESTDASWENTKQTTPVI